MKDIHCLLHNIYNDPYGFLAANFPDLLKWI
jgi:hypothetical protein